MTYPDSDTFDLPYELSGLYERVGFEIAPGTIERVSVVRTGWALRHKGELFPVRRGAGETGKIEVLARTG